MFRILQKNPKRNFTNLSVHLYRDDCC